MKSFGRWLTLCLLCLVLVPWRAGAGVRAEPGLHAGGWNDVVALEIPSGISGAVPSLAVSHDHGHRDGLLGSNYRLQGLSVITRRSASGGVPELGADADSSTFYLDGELLVPQETSGRHVHPAVELGKLITPATGPATARPPVRTHFEPETYTGARLEYDSDRNLWTMRRDGWVWEYGSQEDAGAGATVVRNLDVTVTNPAAANVGMAGAVLLCADGSQLCRTAAWHLSRALDPYGNELVYNYQQLALPGELVDRFRGVQHRRPVPAEIRYAGGRQSVTFSYEERPDPRLDASGGVPAVLSHRLAGIKSWVDEHLFSEYAFSYQDQRSDSADLPNSVLWKVERRATDGAGSRSLRVNEVNAALPGWADGDDSIYLDVIDNPGSDSTSYQHVVFPQAVNLDGDGVSDLLVLAWHCSGLSCTSYHRAYLATPETDEHFVGAEEARGSDLDLITAWNDVLNDHLDGSFLRHGRGYLLADLDNDYRLDLLVEESGGDGESLGEIVLVSHRGGERFTTQPVPELDACKVRFGRLGDVDGDGFQDLIRVVHEETDLCSRANKTRWVANNHRAPHFDWGERQTLSMPLDQSPAPSGWRAIVGGEGAPRPDRLGTAIQPVVFHRAPMLACADKRIGPPEDYSDADSADANLSNFARFGDYNNDGVLDVLYSVHGCYDWSGQEAPTADYISDDSDVSYWYPVEESLYSEIHYGRGDGSFIAGGVHAGYPLYEYYEGWAIPSGGDGDEPPVIDIDPRLPPGTVLDPANPGRLSNAGDRVPESGSSSTNSGDTAAVLARSSSAGWLVQSFYRHRVSPFNPDRAHYSGLLLERDRFYQPHGFAYDRGLIEGYGLSNTKRIPDEIEVADSQNLGDHEVFGDFDGDGMVDLLAINVISTNSQPGTIVWNTRLALNTKQGSRGRTVAATGPWGGTTGLTWGFSAEALHDNPGLPINLEVLTETDGASGRLAYRYAEGKAIYGDFRGFGHVELVNERGGRTVHGFYTEPARIGLQKYGARMRADGSLQHLTVSLFGSRNSVGGYAYNLAPPYFSPLIRNCEYQVGAAAAGGSQTVGLDELVDRCHEYAPPEGLDLRPEIAGTLELERPFRLWWDTETAMAPMALNREALDLTGARNRRRVRTGSRTTTSRPPQLVSTGEISALFLSGRAMKPLLSERAQQDLLLDAWQRSPSALRWRVPEGISLPPKPAAMPSPNAGETELVEFVADYFYDHAARRLDSEHDYQDTNLRTDDRISEYRWQRVGAGHAYRLTEVLLTDHRGARFGRLERGDFDPAGFDNARRVLRCGTGDGSCYEESYEWDGQGRLVRSLAADGGEATWEYAEICGPIAHVDPGGRTRGYGYDELCRKQTETWLTSESEFDHDGYNRLRRTEHRPGGTTPASIITTLQDDKLEVVADREFTEPRLARLRGDGQLELTYLDEFGRLTRKLLCRNAGEDQPEGIDEVSCAEGSELITEWHAYTHDGRRQAQAQAYFPGEPVRVSTYHHDELGDIYAAQHPAHTPLADGAQWLTTRFAAGPGWKSKTDALGREFRTEFTTLTKSETVDGILQSRETVDAFGRFVSTEEAAGIRERYSYDEHNRLASREYVSSFGCWLRGAGGYTFEPDCRGRVEYGYDANGRQNLARFSDGSEQTTQFDAVGRPLQQAVTGDGSTEVLKRWTFHDLEAVPRIETIDEGGNVRTETSGTLGQITREELSGLTIEREYGVHGKPVRIVDENGVETRYEYDLYDRLAAEVVGEVDRTEYRYNGPGRRIERIDADGVTQRWEYTYSGKVAAFALGERRVASRTYDEGGRMAESYERGVYRRRTYDRFDQVVRLESGLSAPGANDPYAVYTYAYDDAHRLTERTAYPVAGQISATTYEHNPIGLLAAVTEADGARTEFEYNGNMKLHRRTDAEGYTALTEYDSRGRVTAQDIPGEGRRRYRYRAGVELPGRDGAFYAVSTSDAEGATWTGFRDAWERSVLTVMPDGTRTAREYQGSLLTRRSIADEEGTILQEVRNVYDPTTGRLERVYGPVYPQAPNDGLPVYTVEYEYSDAGRVEELASPVETIEYRYDTDGLLAEEIYPDRERDFEWSDGYPWLVRETLTGGGKARKTAYSRNRNGNVVKVQIRAGGEVETRQFDRYNAFSQPGRTVSQLNGIAQVRHDWEYTAAGQQRSRETFLMGRSVGAVKWDYYGNGVLRGIQDPAGNRIAYRYGSPFDYRLRTVDDDAGYVYAEIEAHNRRGQITRMALAGNTDVRYGYDAIGRERRREYEYADGAVQRLESEYDALGRRVAERTSDGQNERSTRYEYDGGGRLRRELHSQPLRSIRFSWDLAGNLLRKDLEQAGVATRLYEGSLRGNRLLAANGRRLQYDPWGGVVEDQRGRRFERLPSGLIRSVSTGADELLFLRDAEGVSWAVMQAGRARPMIDLWRQDYSVLPLVSAGADDSRRLFVADEEGRMFDTVRRSGGQVQPEAAVFDQRLTLRGIGGNAVAARDAFGEPLGGPLPVQAEISNFTYQGMASYAALPEMHFARYRAYDPATARFLSRDPAGLRGGLHPYGYVHGDPVNFSDALGLFAIPKTSFSDLGGTSFIPPNTEPGGGWPGGGESDSPFDPGWGKDGCPVLAMCAGDTSGGTEETGGDSSVDASEAEGPDTSEPEAGNGDPTNSNSADLDGYRWDTEIFYDPADGFVSWREGDGELQTADVAAVEQYDEGTKLILEDNPSGATSLFMLDGENQDDGPASSSLSDNTDVEIGSESEVTFGQRLDVLGDVLDQKWTGFTDSLWNAADAAMNPVDTWMNNTPGGLALQGDWNGAGWSMFGQVTMPYRIAGDVVMTGARAVGGTFTNPYHVNRFMFSSDLAEVRYSANQFVDNQIAAVETVSLITPAGAGRKVLMKGLRKAIPNRPKKIGACSLTEGTPVYSEAGWREIEDVFAGDLLASTPSPEIDIEYREVLESYTRESGSYELLELTGEAGEAKGTLGITAEHPVWIVGKGWTEAAEVTGGDRVLTLYGTELTVSARRTVAGRFDVYNVAVADTENYFAGDAGVLVHNCHHYRNDGVTPGPYAVEGTPLHPGKDRNWTARERRSNNEKGDKYGCHTCGTKKPGFKNWVMDEILRMMNNGGVFARVGYPQCKNCMFEQLRNANADWRWDADAFRAWDYVKGKMVRNKAAEREAAM